MKNVGYYNGVIGPIEQMTIPMDDRAVYFGDGVYDATYAANQIIFEADAHIARFFRSAQALRIAPPVTPEALKPELQRCVEPVSYTHLPNAKGQQLISEALTDFFSKEQAALA